mmetsp:Transcript_27102/g.94025  ORF Transcript_27102/g.94025 Transcript_27102/m.94025 type:complete len:244 (-) Transcript_27102:122-853(-)
MRGRTRTSRRNRSRRQPGSTASLLGGSLRKTVLTWRRRTLLPPPTGTTTTRRRTANHLVPSTCRRRAGGSTLRATCAPTRCSSSCTLRWTSGARAWPRRPATRRSCSASARPSCVRWTPRRWVRTSSMGPSHRSGRMRCGTSRSRARSGLIAPAGAGSDGTRRRPPRRPPQASRTPPASGAVSPPPSPLASPGSATGARPAGAWQRRAVQAGAAEGGTARILARLQLEVGHKVGSLRRQPPGG